MPRIVDTAAWIKPFRGLIRTSCGPGWKVRNNRGRMRLEVQDHGSLMLSYPWSEEGAALALPRIQQIFKRWNDGQITLTAAAQTANTSSSNQKIDFNQLIAKCRAFVPNAGYTA